ncbi:MAG: NAD(P)H-hydrate dehydratase [Herbaspirillum sp.]|jgi:hydroxyethylthiazole kinase-like uncharacterized protein yjeF|nr:NAD(P)H-hydrate dehydratase [Herbaspirillum sp.]
MSHSSIRSGALFSVAQIRTIEQAALAALPAYALMQRAGAAAAAAARDLLPDHASARILILAGPGNNGGDAVEAACELSGCGLAVSVLLIDSDRRPPDAQRALERARDLPIDWITADHLTAQSQWTLVLDGLFGIGMARAAGPDYRALFAYVNRLACPVLALDAPSGLNADTGCVTAPDGEADADAGDLAVRATHTITFIAGKPGLHTCDGRDYSGQVLVADLQIDGSLFPDPDAMLNGPDLFAAGLQPRAQNSHKGSFGDVGIVGGADGMAGAVILAARAAACAGAGRVYAGFLGQAPAYDPPHPELMCRRADAIDLSRSTLALGPGLGNSRDAHDLLSHALHAPGHLVLDADALNLLAAEPGLRQKLISRRRPAATLLTPHPLEAARLLDVTAAAVQADRLQAARRLADRFQAIVVLKGSGTVIARPDGLVAINPTGNPALATAGSGDVLSGVCAALLAQHWEPWQAALGAVWLHGAAADALVTQGIGPIGMHADELTVAIRRVLNDLIAERGRRRP